MLKKMVASGRGVVSGRRIEVIRAALHYEHMFAPAEKEHPTIKARRMLRGARDRGTYVSGVGLVDAEELRVSMTLQRGYALALAYMSGWRNASVLGRPDRGLVPMSQLIGRGAMLATLVDDTRNYIFQNSEGAVVASAPFVMTDIEACGGSREHAYDYALQLFREDVSIVHIEDQKHEADPFDKGRVCGHQVGGAQSGTHVTELKHKEPKALVYREAWLQKLMGALLAANRYSQLTRGAARPLVLARTDAPNGRLPDGTVTDLKYAVDSLVEAYNCGVEYGWVEFNTLSPEDHFFVAVEMARRAPGMTLFINLSPNLYNMPHELTNDGLAQAGYTGQFSTIPLTVSRHVWGTYNFLKVFVENPFEALLELERQAVSTGFRSELGGFHSNQVATGMNWWTTLGNNIMGSPS